MGVGDTEYHLVFLEGEITGCGSSVWCKRSEWQEQQNLVFISRKQEDFFSRRNKYCQEEQLVELSENQALSSEIFMLGGSLVHVLITPVKQ